MDKTRSKRPPDVNEALSSMLWTPYDETANTSSSDSLTDYERQRGQRKLNRYSNPLPNSLNWWNSHIPDPQPMAVRYSFPYYGNYLPTSENFSSATTTTKRTISTTIDVGNHSQTINTSTFSTTMVHSFTDDFHQYQVIKIVHSCSRYLWIVFVSTALYFGGFLLFTLAFHVHLDGKLNLESVCNMREFQVVGCANRKLEICGNNVTADE